MAERKRKADQEELPDAPPLADNNKSKSKKNGDEDSDSDEVRRKKKKKKKLFPIPQLNTALTTRNHRKWTSWT